MTPTVACAAAFMLGSFLLNFFSLGDVGLTIGSVGVTEAANSQSTAPPSFINYACNLGAFGFPAFDQFSRLHQLLACHLPLACACYSNEKY